MRPSNRRALIVLFLVNLLVFLVDYYYWELFPAQVLYSEAQVEAQKRQWEKEKLQLDSLWAANLKPFDPNTVDSAYLSAIGIPTKALASWIYYTKMGGRYYTLSQMKGIRGLDSTHLQRIQAFIQFPKKEFAHFDKEEGSTELLPRYFDPNTISLIEMEKMGLPHSARRGIVSFREKYRPFTQAEDLYQVYGLDTSLAIRLIPWIRIRSDSAATEVWLGPFDLNQADSAQLSRVSGIGPYRAKRILEWRARLGGFHSLAQLQMHQILDSLQILQVQKELYCGPLPAYLYLNYDDLETLKQHPYINYYLARNIINFREQVRAFKKVEELMNIELVDDVLFSKLAPYLKVSPRDTLK